MIGGNRLFTPEAIQSLNQLELSLYTYIRLNKEKVVYMRIRDLANEAHVSTTTILNFCRKVQCNGFLEFKVKLRIYVEGQEAGGITDDKTEFLGFLERSNHSAFQANIIRASQMIFDAYQLYFIGTGNSGAVAAYGARYFTSLGKFAVAINDPYIPCMGKKHENTVAVILSVSGETFHCIHQADLLKGEGGKVISITNSKNCTLAKISDINFAYYVQFQKNGDSNVTSQLPVVHIIESIGKRVHNLLKKKHSE